jgi:nucleoside-diphosphate-sugar epimerase
MGDDGRAVSDESATVLVTGGTGFLGGWCVAELLRRGHTVRTSVRDVAREPAVRATVERAGVEADGRLSVVAANLSSDDGWADAVAGCDYVLHVASPFPPEQPKDPGELIVPAREGALRVVAAALDADVKRIVMTSSVAAVRHGRPAAEDKPYTEEDWTDGNDTKRTPYVRSKTLAERAAWDHVKAAGAEDRLATIEPGAIIGPVLNDDHSFSMQAVQRLLDGAMPAIPKLGFTFVDVRDVADLHIRAMTDPAGAGERFLAVDEFLWIAQVADILRERLGDRASKVPTRNAPNLLVRAMSLFDGGLRSIVDDLGKTAYYSNAKARERLGWEPRPVGDSIADTGESLLAHPGA